MDENHGSLFTGLGGFDIASEWMGWNNAFNCEIDSFCRTILDYYWPYATKYKDITKTDFSIWRNRIGVLSGGFPCQPFSNAGLKKGTTDNRYLWPEMLRAIREIQPAAIVGENVTGIISMGKYEVFAKVEGRSITRFADIDRYEAIYIRQEKMLVNSICEQLEKDGYKVQPFIVPAAGVNAPHKRERVWFVAYSDSFRINYNERTKTNNVAWEQPENTQQKRNQRTSKVTGFSPERIITDSTSEGPKERKQNRRQSDKKENGTGMEFRDKRFGNNATSTNPNLQRFEMQGKQPERSNERNTFGEVLQWNASDTQCVGQQRQGRTIDASDKTTDRNWKASWAYDDGRWPTQSPVCSRNDGISSRLDGITFSKHRTESIKGFGNAVVPQVVVEFFKAIEILMNY